MNARASDPLTSGEPRRPGSSVGIPDVNGGA